MSPQHRRTHYRAVDLTGVGEHHTERGTIIYGDLDVDATAKALKVSKETVQQAYSEIREEHRTRIFTAVTGRGGDISGQAAGGDIREFLRAGFGRPDGRIDTKAASQALGVPRRTVQYWASGARQPGNPERLAQAAAHARLAATSQMGRHLATNTFRASARGKAMLNRGGKVKVKGVQGPGLRYTRADREPIVDMLAADVDAMLDAYDKGGDVGLQGFLEDLFDSNYVEGWTFASIDGIEFLEP